MGTSLTAQAQVLLAELGWLSRPLGTIGVTSCHGREGVSTVATAMAQAAAPSGRCVLLAEAPRLAEPAAGRRPVAPGDKDEENVSWGQATPVPGLFNLSSAALGRIMRESGFGAAGIDRSLSRLREQYELCVFDLPPVLANGQGANLAARLDATVIVIRSGSTSVEDVRRTQRVLARNGVKVSGAVLNRYRA